MKLHAPFIQLPIRFDATVLAEEVAALDPALWRPHPQGFPGNSMLPLVSVGGDPANEAFAGAMQPTPVLQRLPYLGTVFASLGATIGRSRLMKLSGHAEVTRHADQHYYWAERVRVHVPILTQPTVRFECGDAVVNMAPGECWIFDTWRQHRVVNDAVEERIHLVVDTVGGGRFWDLVARGRGHADARPGWAAEPVPPAGSAPPFACETRNIPVVMSPWEMNALFAQLFADALPHPRLPQVHELSGRLSRRWQGLWFEHGEDPAGHPAYRAALADYVEAVRPLGQSVMLNNELQWFGAMMMMIGRYAIRPAEAR